MKKIKDKQLNLKNIFKNNEHIMHNNILTYMGNDEFSLLEKNEKKKISDEKYLELIYQFYGTHQVISIYVKNKIKYIIHHIIYIYIIKT